MNKDELERRVVEEEVTYYQGKVIYGLGNILVELDVADPHYKEVNELYCEAAKLFERIRKVVE